jgi:hypothetical protein
MCSRPSTSAIRGGESFHAAIKRAANQGEDRTLERAER